MNRITPRGLALALRNILIALLALALLAVNASTALIVRPNLGDFGSFIASGRAALAGENPYGVYSLTGRVRVPGFELNNPNLNPPFSLLFFEPLAGLDWGVAYLVWRVVSGIIALATVAVLIRAYRPSPRRVAWALLAFPVWGAAAMTQIYVPLFALTAAAWLLLDRRRDALAGIVIGFIVAWKPNLAVWPVFLFLAGHRRVALVAAGACAVCSLLPVLRYGPGVYLQWLALVTTDGERAAYPTNLSLVGLFARAGLTTIGQSIALALLAPIAYIVWRRRPAPNDTGAVALVSALLASPVAWLYYAVLLWPALLRRRWTPAIAAGAALLLYPIGLHLADAFSPLALRLTVGALHVWALVLLTIGFLPSLQKERRVAAH